MRFGLRWRILLFTVLPPVALTAGALWAVQRGVSHRLYGTAREELGRASHVFDNMLATRAEKLLVASQVIARDPRFFSILDLTVSERDKSYKATVKRVARDFVPVAKTDVFEVFDRRGRLLASVGETATSEKARAALVKAALEGKSTSEMIVAARVLHQAVAVPVMAGRTRVGVLLLGSGLDRTLARSLRDATRSEVTFLSSAGVPITTLESPEEASALEKLAAKPVPAEADAPAQPGVKAEARLAYTVMSAGKHTYLTLVLPIPGAAGGRYAMQRSLGAEAAFLRETQTTLFQLGLAAALVALIAGLLVADRISRPVHRLVRGAVEMEKGNYDYPIEVATRDEIGYLADRFKEMRRHERNYVHNLEEVARLRGDFLNVASHELRTPISIIKGYHELFMDGSLGHLSQQQSQALAAIRSSVERLDRIAEDATWMSQMQDERPRLELAEHKVSDLVEHSIQAALREARERTVAVASELDPEIPAMSLDGPRMTQAITSLVRNGIRFTPDGGAVTVRARIEETVLVIEVQDSGIGMSEEEQRRIFERPVVVGDAMHHHSSEGLEFRSAGLGFGLAIARGIVEAHGGRLDVASEPGKGSTFTIRMLVRTQEARVAA